MKLNYKIKKKYKYIIIIFILFILIMEEGGGEPPPSKKLKEDIEDESIKLINNNDLMIVFDHVFGTSVGLEMKQRLVLNLDFLSVSSVCGHQNKIYYKKICNIILWSAIYFGDFPKDIEVTNEFVTLSGLTTNKHFNKKITLFVRDLNRWEIKPTIELDIDINERKIIDQIKNDYKNEVLTSLTTKRVKNKFFTRSRLEYLGIPDNEIEEQLENIDTTVEKLIRRHNIWAIKTSEMYLIILSSSEDKFPLDLWEQKNSELNLNKSEDNFIWKLGSTSRFGINPMYPNDDKLNDILEEEYSGEPVLDMMDMEHENTNFQHIRRFEDPNTEFRIIIFALLDAESEKIDKSKVPISNLYKIMDSEKRGTKKQYMGTKLDLSVRMEPSDPFRIKEVPFEDYAYINSFYIKTLDSLYRIRIINIAKRGIDITLLLGYTKKEHRAYISLFITRLNRPNLFDDDLYIMFKNTKNRNYLFFGEKPKKLPTKNPSTSQ